MLVLKQEDGTIRARTDTEKLLKPIRAEIEGD